MSDVEPAAGPEPTAPRRRRARIFGRWPNRSALLLPPLVLVMGLGGWLLVSSGDDAPEVSVEAADSLGADPFTTAGITLASSSSPAGGSPSPGLFGGSGDNGVCNPAGLVTFLEGEPDKARAWVAALNADATMRWSGGDELAVAQIAEYVGELTPTTLTRDTRVVNHGFRNGEATPRDSVLEEGTAVLVDAQGDVRVRCFCGNPLHPDPESEPPVAADTPSPAVDEPTAEPSLSSESPTPEPTIEASCDPNVPETDGCGPEPLDCDPVPALPSSATDVTTGAVDFNGDGTPDVLRVYKDAGVWHVQAEIGSIVRDDDVLSGPGPSMAVLGGATVNADPSEEGWVKVGSGSATDIVSVMFWTECDLVPVELNGSPAQFPVGATATAADGVGCFGFDVGIQVFSTTSTDGLTYTGTSTIYTIDTSSLPPSFVSGGTANESETSTGGSFGPLHTFQCDSLSGTS